MPSKSKKKANQITNTITLLVCMLIGFWITYINNYEKTKKSNTLQELILITGGNCYHIHHYMICILIIASLLMGNALHKYKFGLYCIIALFAGVAAEDLLYTDWMLIKNNCHKSQIIKELKNTTDVQKVYN